jgi:hypothetical protein
MYQQCIFVWMYQYERRAEARELYGEVGLENPSKALVCADSTPSSPCVAGPFLLVARAA